MNTTQKVIKGFAICLAVLIILSIINGIVFLATSTIGFNNDVNISEAYSSNIKNINIDVVSTNMIIKKGDILSIDADNVSKKFKIKEQGNTLSIKEKKITIFGNKKGSSIIITIPETLGDLNIDIGAGKLEISDITTDKFSLDQGAGKVDITNSKLQDLSLDLGAGKFYFNGTLLGKNEIDQGVGEVILDLQNNDYKFETSKGLGSITINGVSYKNDIKLGEGQNIIDIDGGIGSISINTNK